MAKGKMNIKEAPQIYSADQQFLINHGWRLITTGRGKYSPIYYWDHDKYRLSSGLWWTQCNALIFQRRKNKENKSK